MNMKIVGLASLNSEIVEDDVDILPTFIPLTPAFAREALAHGGLSSAVSFGITTSGGAATVPLVEREIARVAPRGDQVTDHALTPVVAKADRALKPISIALGVFGAVALSPPCSSPPNSWRAGCAPTATTCGSSGPWAPTRPTPLLDGLIGLEAALRARVGAGRGRGGRRCPPCRHSARSRPSIRTPASPGTGPSSVSGSSH